MSYQSAQLNSTKLTSARLDWEFLISTHPTSGPMKQSALVTSQKWWKVSIFY